VFALVCGCVSAFIAPAPRAVVSRCTLNKDILHAAALSMFVQYELFARSLVLTVISCFKLDACQWRSNTKLLVKHNM
jgi:hypothetical protein